MAERVYVVQETKITNRNGEQVTRNLVPALEYGSVETLLAPDAHVLNAQPVVEQIKARLTRFDDEDFLIAMGDPVAIMIAGAVAAIANRGRFTVLKWEKTPGKYYPIPVDLGLRR